MNTFNYLNEIKEQNEFDIKDNKTSTLRRFFCVFLLSLMILSCVTPAIVSEAAVPKTTKVTLSKSSVSLYKGQLYRLTAKKANSRVKHKSIKWSTSNKKIAIVNQKGYVKGIKKGTAYVYCKVKWKNNKTTTVRCKVKVYNPVKLKSFKLNKTSFSLKPGAKVTLKSVVAPSNATITKVAFATSNKKIATVSSKGVIVAKGAGSCKICCAIKTYNGKVYKKYATVKVEVPTTSISLNKTQESLYVGQNTTLKVTISPSNATNKGVTFKSSNTGVATVSSSGVVSAKSIGNCNITATTKEGKVATYKLTVKTPYEIKMDKVSLDLKLETSGNVKATIKKYYGENKTFTYSSSNTKVATVSKDGQIIATTAGTAIITASVVNPTAGVTDKYNIATCTVKVTKADINLYFTKEPYLSTYYFDPKPSCKEDTIIPIYLTDTDNKEYLQNDSSKRFDVMVEIDGKVSYVRDMKPGDNKVNLGKLTKGNHYFALQIIDKDTGLKSHKLYNDLMVIDPEEYAIKESETYYMTEADLTKYSIDNTNNMDKEVCVATKNGLNKLFVDTKANGYRKIVMLKGTYRVDSEGDRTKSLTIPSYFTIDMNEGTIKLNTVEENNISSSIFMVKDATDAHLTNGTLEGDRFERKELGLETEYNGEPINTFLFNGCKYSSLTNMTIKATTGHTVGTGYVWGPGNSPIATYTKTEIIDGKEVASNNRSTSNYVDLSKIKAWTEYVSVGQAEGYRGIKGNSSIIYVHFYNKDKEFINTVTGYQFRKIRIPKEAVYGRVTLLGDLNRDHNVSFHAKHLGDYLEVSDIDFIDTRTTALAPSTCNNMLIENVRYTRAGNSITPCAVDFEDGWQECQDVYYLNNEVVVDSGTATLIDNSGYNHVYENNMGHRFIIRRGVVGAVIRNMDCTKANYLGNIRWTYGNSIVAKYNRVYDCKTGNISVDISESDISRGAPKFIVKDCQIEATSIGSTTSHVTYTNCKFTKFNGSNMVIKDSVIYPTSYLGDKLYFTDCTFKNLEQEGGEIGFSFNLLDAVREFNNCKFVGKTTLKNHNGFNTGTFNNCTFDDMNLSVGCSGEDNKPGIVFNNCNIKSTAEHFINFGPHAYSRGSYNIKFNNSRLELSAGNLIYMYSKPTAGSIISFNECTIVKNEGKLLNGYSSISNMEEVELSLVFNKCNMNKNLDDSYKGTNGKVTVEYK